MAPLAGPSALLMPLILCSIWLTARPCAAVALLRGCFQRYEPKTVVVGGALGWQLGVDTAWVNRPRVYTGDRLRFHWPRGQEHDIVVVSKAAYRSCRVDDDQGQLSERNYTTAPLQEAGIFYYACSEANGGHCRAGQKVKIRVRTAPRYVRCPSPPAPPPPPPPRGSGSQTVKVGNSPNFWSFGMGTWSQPRVKTGDTLLFFWDTPIKHDLVKMPNRNAFQNCNFGSYARLSQKIFRGNITYRVSEPAGAELFFGCSIGFHCAGDMKVAIRVT